MKAGAVRALALRVADEEGETLSAGYAVNWYEKGGKDIIATGDTLSFPADDTKEYEYEIVLDETLGKAYIEPPRQTADDGGSGTITVTLEKIPEVMVSGRVLFDTGEPAGDIAVRFDQYPNGRYSAEQTVQTDADGLFSAAALRVNTDVTISEDEYFDIMLKDAVTSVSPAAVDLGTLTLAPLGNKKVAISATGTRAAVVGGGETYGLFSFVNMDFSVRNVTQGRALSRVTVRYPYLSMLGEELHAGDVIEIAASDRQGLMTAAPVRVALGDDLNAFADIVFVDNGRFTAAAEGDIRVMIFDASGAYAAGGAFQNMFLSPPLSEGDYTAVFLEETDLLKRVSRIEKLTELGLEENTDFTAKGVRIENGRILELGAVSVPKMDLQKIFYTDTAAFEANKPSLALGAGFVSYRLSYAISDKYTSSGETVSFEFPEGMEYYAGTVTLDGAPVSGLYENRTLTVRANRREGVIRFCATPDEVGEQAVTAFLRFDKDEGAVVQTLGTAVVTAEAMLLNIPKKTAQTQVAISGLAGPGSAIVVYDNGYAIASAIANSGGKWSVKAELYKPYAFSTHRIYAAAINERGVRVLSEEKALEYNMTYANVARVVMYNVASSGHEIATIIDFQTAVGKTPVYSYNPSYPKFTFVAEVENPDAAASVTFVVTGANGKVVRLPATRLPVSGAWAAAADFDTAGRPQQIAVSFDDDPEEVQFSMSASEIDDAMDEEVEILSNLVGLDDENLAAFKDEFDAVLTERGITTEFKADQIIDGIEYGVETTTIAGSGISTTATKLLPVETSEATLLAQGYVKFPDSEYTKDIYYLIDESGMMTYVDFAHRQMIQYSFEWEEGVLEPFAETEIAGAEDHSMHTLSTDWDIMAELNKMRQDAAEAIRAAQEVSARMNAVAEALQTATTLEQANLIQQYAVATSQEANEYTNCINASVSRSEDYANKIQTMEDMVSTSTCLTAINDLRGRFNAEKIFFYSQCGMESLRNLYGVISDLKGHLEMLEWFAAGGGLMAWIIGEIIDYIVDKVVLNVIFRINTIVENLMINQLQIGRSVYNQCLQDCNNYCVCGFKEVYSCPYHNCTPDKRCMWEPCWKDDEDGDTDDRDADGPL
ncbi:MAG: hypothetical protein LBS85_04290, partial [Clostridiales Family XIII bacterium]|nr:hypothetical protein [Clostridiales Family XIII bacterium]